MAGLLSYVRSRCGAQESIPVDPAQRVNRDVLPNALSCVDFLPQIGVESGAIRKIADQDRADHAACLVEDGTAVDHPTLDPQST
jgi:hypothetical protein